MFWGDEPEERARHSLSNALSGLRAVLGRHAILAGRDDVSLTPDAHLATDAIEFVSLCEGHDAARAIALYAGPFLDNLSMPADHAFAGWIARERARLERLFLTASERHVPQLLRDGDWAACATHAERWLRAAPRSAPAFVALLKAAAGPDTLLALRTALAEYRRLRDWLFEGFAIRPDQSVAVLAAEIDERLALREASLVSDPKRSSSTDDLLVPPPRTTPESSDSRQESAYRSAARDAALGAIALSPPEAVADLWRAVRRTRVATVLAAGTCAVAGAVIFGALLAGGTLRRPALPATPRPVVAVTAIDNVRGDSALAWLEEGLPQLIADDLAHTTLVDAVAPSRIRDVRRREGTLGAPLRLDAALDVARRVGASWAVTGGLTGGGGLYVLDVEIRQVETGRSVASFTVRANDPVQLGHLAAARVLEAEGERSGAGDALARFAGVATTSAAAYQHFVRGLSLAGDGRYPEDADELDAAIALDSGFVGALRERRDIAATHVGEREAEAYDRLIDGHRERMSKWDQLEDATERAFREGSRVRSEALGAYAVAQFPADPRAYELLANVLIAHGQWRSAESLYVRELALDSLAIEAGNGPCVPCDAFEGLVTARAMRGDLDGAIHAGLRWVSVHPASPKAWDALESAFSFAGRDDEAIVAGRRAVSLSRDPNVLVSFGRTLLMARQYEAVDSLIGDLRTSADGALRVGAIDLAAMLARERGEYRRSVVTLRFTDAGGLVLVRADGLARDGRLDDARRLFEASGHADASDGAGPITASGARAYAWAHALEGEALARAGDTTAIRFLADSIAVVGAHSYYGRDWHLYHHLLALVHEARGEWSVAEHEFHSARWGATGWTSSVEGEARAQLAQHRPLDAVASRRAAYAGPLDAMGRYVPRTELDYWMARAWLAADRGDSASRYVGRVRRAWAHADPHVRQLLDGFPSELVTHADGERGFDRRLAVGSATN